MQFHSSTINCILTLVLEQLLISEWQALIYWQTWPRILDVLLLILPLDCGIVLERVALLCLFRNKNVMCFSSQYCRFSCEHGMSQAPLFSPPQQCPLSGGGICLAWCLCTLSLKEFELFWYKRHAAELMLVIFSRSFIPSMVIRDKRRLIGSWATFCLAGFLNDELIFLFLY